MDPAWARVEELFHAALERPESEREAWLAAQTESAPGVLEEARSLLAADRRHGELCAQTPGAAETPDGRAIVAETGAGLRFGPYETQRLLGRGGMGAVYLARRVDGQFDQAVALKVMAPHLAGEEFVRIFRNERQLLAGLAHPNIARLLDGGVSSDGSPYLVMEYIEGRLWNQYCAERKLTIQERIRLFLQVCDAVECAHRNLIVHGDLKPANILVNREGTITLLDFGTAKVVRDPEGRVTQFAALTPRYASPEQMRGERVNTLSDVFSLGVILYETVTGVWPFGNPASAADAADRILQRREADSPSQTISESAAAERGATRERLRRQVRGDPSTILRKMLASEPARRYGSVREAREDLERYLQGRPVRARAHSAWYAGYRFTARHRLAVSATAASLVALAGLTLFSVRQSTQARAQAARAERVSEFAKDTFLSAGSYWHSPLSGKHNAIQFSDILDNATARVGQELGNDPEAEADLRSTLGFTYALLGEPAKGEPQLLLGIRLLSRVRGGAPKVAAGLYANLCDARSFQGRYAEALDACKQAVSLYRVVDHSVLGAALHDTAFMAVNAGEPLPEAEAMYREALEFPRPNQDVFNAVVKGRLGLLRLRQGDLDGGERLLAEAEPPLRGSGEPMTEIVPILYARAFGATVRGQYEEAVRLMSEALDLVTRRQAAYMGPDELALQLAAYEALAGDRGALAQLRKVEGRLESGTAPPVDRIRHGLFAGIVEANCGSKALAERHLRTALATEETEMSAQPDIAVEICVRLMELLRSSQREQEALATARRGLSAAGRAYGWYYAVHPFVRELGAAARLEPAKY